MLHRRVHTSLAVRTIYSLLTVVVLQKVYHTTYKYTEEKARPTRLGTPYNKVCFRSDKIIN